MRKTILLVIVGLVLIVSGCSTSQEAPPTSSVISSASGQPDSQVSSPSISKIQKEQNTTTRRQVIRKTEYNNTSTYTTQFITLIKNDSTNVSKLDNPYDGTRYDRANLNITNVEVRPIPPDDQNIIVISQNYNKLNASHYRKSISKISIVFATILKREAINDDGDWNVSQARILTYERGSLKIKNRIEFDWAGNWVFRLLDWTVSGYVEDRVISTMDVYNKDGFNTEHDGLLESKIESNSSESNISRVHVNQSGAALFLTYTTTTPPSQNHMSKHITEYEKIVHNYGYIDKK